MAISNFIPTIWSTALLTALDRQYVFAQDGVVNRDYEGEIRAFGDTVRINSIGDPTIKDYTRNADIDTPEELTGAQMLLTIDQMKYFNFAVDDVDKRQANLSVISEAMHRTGEGLRNKVDSFVSAAMKAATPSDSTLGTTGTPKTISASTDVYNYLVDLGTKLDEADVPQEGRWVIMPPWALGHLLKDARFVDHGTPSNQDRLLNGQVKRAAGFTVMQSNTVVNTGGATYFIQAGTSRAFSFAEQILEVEAYRPERRFGDAIKGLHVYGGRVIRPEFLALLIITKA